MEENVKKKGGLKLMVQLLLIVAVTMLVLFFFAIAAVKAVCNNVSDKMVAHELNTAQYAFNVAVNGIADDIFQYKDGSLYKGNINVSENTQFFDNFSNQVDLEVSIFYGDTRVATSLIDKNGNRMVNGN